MFQIYAGSSRRPEEMEAASDGYCRSCKKLFNREGKNILSIFSAKKIPFLTLVLLLTETKLLA